MRRLILITTALAAASAATAGERLPHGAIVDDVRIKRTDIEVSQPFFVAQADQTAPVPAPPDIDEPGGNTVTLDEAMPEAGEKVLPRERAEGETPSDEVTAPDADAPLPPKVQESETIQPAVTIRTEGDLTIEEYRRDGNVYMVVVTPTQGPKQTYMDTDGNGRLETTDNDLERVQPVFYTLYEWDAGSGGKKD